MRTYTEVFRAPEFTALFVSSSAQVAASTISGLAAGTYVYARTGSPLLSALAMFGPSLAQLAGATVLLSAADRLPPRAAMAWIALAYGLGTAAQAIPGLPVAAIFAIAVALGVQWSSPATAMAIMAAASVTVTLGLAPGLRPATALARTP